MKNNNQLDLTKNNSNGVELEENEKKVLEVFMKETDTWGEVCLNVKGIVSRTLLEEKEVRSCCRKLTQYKLIEYMRGLMDDDGKVAGAGYCITGDGKKHMFPCQKCGEEAHYSWHENKKGEWISSIFPEEVDKYFQLCEEHYQELKK